MLLLQRLSCQDSKSYKAARRAEGEGTSAMQEPSQPGLELGGPPGANGPPMEYVKGAFLQFVAVLMLSEFFGS